MLDWVKTIIHSIGYPGITLLMILENIFPPIPSEIIMPFAGFVVGQDELSFTGVVLAGTIGSVLGTLPFYYAGRKIGEERLKKWADRNGRWLMLSSDDIVRAREWFDRHDSTAVFLGRLVPGIRTLISIPAGIERMSFPVFLLLSLLGTSLWVGLLTYFGRLLGRNYHKLAQYLDPVSYIVIGGLLIAYLMHVIRHKNRND